MEPYLSVSVVIPAWNSRETIGSCIKSFISQLYRPCEIIVVNDGSTDDTANVAASFSSCDLPVRLISLNVNSGPAHARNVGIRSAKGEVICFAEADGIYGITYLSRTITALKLTGEKIYSGGILKICWRKDEHWAAFWNAIFEARWHLIMTGQIPPRGGWVFYKKSLEDVGYYDESLRQGEDTELILRLNRNGYKPSLAFRVFFYHMEPQSIRDVWKRFFKAGAGGLSYRMSRGSLLQDSFLSCVIVVCLILFPVNLIMIPVVVMTNRESRVGWIRLLRKVRRGQITMGQAVLFPFRYFYVKLAVACGLIYGLFKRSYQMDWT